ncbi:MAG: ATP-binding cassette domain-containing protein [Hyphomicrobiales bacterium]|nr:ATP-binding cassette domain-containing protein [Hyphomicrobiales bacterium]
MCGPSRPSTHELRLTDQPAALSDAETADATARRRPRLRPLLAMAPYVLRYPRMLTLAGVALVASAVAMLSVPVAVRRMIDHGFSGADGVFIDRYFTMLIAIGAVLAVASSMRFYAVNWLGERVVADLRADVFKHLLTLGPAFYDVTRSGEVTSRLTADTTQLKSAAGSTISQALRNMIMLCGALTMMVVTSPLLTSLVLVAIPAIVLPLMAAGRRVRDRSRAAQDSLADASALASENLGAMRTLQAMTAETSIGRRFSAAVEAAFEQARGRLVARAVLTAAAIFLVVGSVVGVLWFGATLVVKGDMTGGRLGQFVLYALFAGGAMAELAEVWGEVSQAAGAAERLQELRAARPEVVAPANPVALPEPPRGTLAFRDVRFAYPTRRETSAIDGISFEVPAGETVAIIGPSGAGKSTIFALALRFYDPQSGSILIDGIPVRDADPHAVRRRLALVPQDVALFADTVAANIAYGLDEATRPEIEAAARVAEADRFIRALPRGYDTLIGERGITLSGGQRQRIAIARAVLRNAPILLLDEATSALDAESEELVQKALASLARTRTTLVIAHRLATVQSADRILVMDQGRIVEEGTHDTLLARRGLYARLARLQFGLEAA